VSRAWHPRAGEIIWVNFDPQAGHEQAGVRPGLVISASRFNRESNVILVCPITTRGKGNPFEVGVPEGLKTKGVVLSQHAKSIDWRARKAQPAEMAPAELLEAVRYRLRLILELT
jgi:mRNA interferase MazF